MFIEKLNRKRNGAYTIEEQKQISDGTWEGILDHDNVMTDTISMYTGPKFTGDKIDNFIISTPSETPWKTYIRIFTDADVVYITYESLGDQVEADDINLLQDELVNEMNRSKDIESELDVKIDTETSRAKDIELNLGNKIDNEIQRATTADTTIDNKVDNEIIRSVNMDNTVNDKINSEMERSQNVENALNADIIQEIDRAENREQILQSNITAEVSRSKKAEEDLNITIGNERTRAVGRETGIENNLNAHIDNYNLEIQRLDGIDVQLESNKADKIYVNTELDKKYNKDQVFTKEETLQRIQGIIGTAPDALDTLEELARALDNDPDFATNIVNLLSTKVDKVDGKQLSANDFTDLLKLKLDKIEDGANKYIHPDKHNANMIVEDSTKRFVSDMEKAGWNARETPSGAQTKADTAEDNAKAYTDVHDNNTIKHITSTERGNWNDANLKKHTHSNKSILDTITQTLIDAWNSAVEHMKDTVRHITSAERTKWNSKADGVHKHIKGEITDFPTSLPANGGNADTLGGKSASEYATKQEVDSIEIGGRNLFIRKDIDTTQCLSGSLIGYTGDSNYIISGFIPVLELQQYIKSGETGSGRVGFFDINKDFIDVISVSDNIPFTTPANCQYIRINILVSNKDNDIKVEKGNKATDWTPAPEDIQTEIDKKADKTELPTKLSQLAKDINFDERYYTESEVDTKLGDKANKTDIPTKVSQLSNDKNYVTSAELGSAGYGDMMKSTYDKDNDGVVDDAEKVNGHTVESDVPVNAEFTDTIYIHPSTHNAGMILMGNDPGLPLDKVLTTYVQAINGDIEILDHELATKANKTEIPTGLSQLTKDINFDERYYTEDETDAKLNTKSNVGHHHDDNYIGRGPITCDQLKGVW